MNKKGQALVEFILILPVIVLLLLTVFDYVNILNNRVTLDSYLDEIVLNEKYNLPNDITIEKEENTYIISKNINLYSPIMTSIYDKNYLLIEKRIIS